MALKPAPAITLEPLGDDEATWKKFLARGERHAVPRFAPFNTILLAAMDFITLFSSPPGASIGDRFLAITVLLDNVAPLYQKLGLEYDCSYHMPFEAVRRNDLHTAAVGEVNAHWRTVAKWT